MSLGLYAVCIVGSFYAVLCIAVFVIAWRFKLPMFGAPAPEQPQMPRRPEWLND